MAAIAMNPFPNPQFPNLTEDTASDGRTVYSYSDHSFPYAILMIRIEEEHDLAGVVAVIDVRRLPGR